MNLTDAQIPTKTQITDKLTYTIALRDNMKIVNFSDGEPGVRSAKRIKNNLPLTTKI